MKYVHVIFLTIHRTRVWHACQTRDWHDTAQWFLCVCATCVALNIIPLCKTNSLPIIFFSRAPLCTQFNHLKKYSNQSLMSENWLSTLIMTWLVLFIRPCVVSFSRVLFGTWQKGNFKFSFRFHTLLCNKFDKSKCRAL